MKRIAVTIANSLLVSTSSHFVSTLVCYFWLIYDNEEYSIDRSILFWVLYHLIALYVSFTGLRILGYFRDKSSLRTTIYATIFILTHFISFFFWVFYKQAVIQFFMTFLKTLIFFSFSLVNRPH